MDRTRRPAAPRSTAASPGSRPPRTGATAPQPAIRRGRRGKPTRGWAETLAEAVKLTRDHGAATAALWHEWLHPDCTRECSDSSWHRFRRDLVEHGVPHRVGTVADLMPSSRDAVAAPGTMAIRVDVAELDTERYAERRKRCRGACGEWLPARPPFFYRDVTKPGGLKDVCATCWRAKVNSSRGHSSMPERRSIAWLVSRAVAQATYGISPHGRFARKRAREEEKKHPERNRARVALAKALRSGRVVKADACELAAACPGAPLHAPGQSLMALYASRDRETRLENIKWVCRVGLAAARSNVGNAKREGETT